MRKFLWAMVMALALVGPAVLASDSAENQETDSASWWVEPTESGDVCREECAEEGADPDECQMDCNTIA